MLDDRLRQVRTMLRAAIAEGRECALDLHDAAAIALAVDLVLEERPRVWGWLRTAHAELETVAKGRVIMAHGVDKAFGKRAKKAMGALGWGRPDTEERNRNLVGDYLSLLERTRDEFSAPIPCRLIHLDRLRAGEDPATCSRLIDELPTPERALEIVAEFHRLSVDHCYKIVSATRAQWEKTGRPFFKPGGGVDFPLPSRPSSERRKRHQTGAPK
ncbi:hypothetical protein K2X89_02025 [Myxococcota bacterium]|nr:hypothetical protein [Myxococcota bacterium]